MKKRLLLLLLTACCTLGGFAQQKIKVACIGNSITFGRGLGDSTYPAHLQRLMGDGYEVRNYGVGGRTLLQKGDKPYVAEQAFTDAKAWQPDIVVIKLGTNDSKPRNWDANKADFVPDYLAFVDEWKQLSSHPKIYLCLPVPVWDNKFTIRESVVKGEIIPALKKIAKAEGLKVIDLYKALINHRNLFKDGVHPNQVGAVLIAEAVYKRIK